MKCKIIIYIVVQCVLGIIYAYPQTSIFVSLHGSDNGSGDIHSPYSSIEKALQESRKLQGGVTIYIRKGVYRLNQPLVITPQDGNEHKELTICAYPEEKVVLTSANIINHHWKHYKGKIFKTAVAGLVAIDQLFVNGMYRPMARYPNYDSLALKFNGCSDKATSKDKIKKWHSPKDGYLHVMHSSDWGSEHYRIVGKNDDNSLQLEGGWQNNRPSAGHKQNRMVENIFEELDAPGEWYYDKNKKELYYIPIAGEDINQAIFETPTLNHLVELKGNKEIPVQNVTIKDIDFTLTNRTFMERYEALLRSDWAIYRGGCIVLEGTKKCHINNCNLYNLGGNAIFFSMYNYQSSIRGCHLFQIGASGICFVGNHNAVHSPAYGYHDSLAINKISRVVGFKTIDFPRECIVYDNLIHHIGLFEKQVAGVQLSMCSSIIVSHNSIYHTPRAGININEGTWGGHIIEYNDVFNTVRETGDHGSFNSWGRDRFWRSNRIEMDDLVEKKPSLILLDAVKENVIRYNRFKCDHGWDIDLDDGSSNYHIYNNLCLGGGIKLREGFYRTVENNILINNTLHPHVWFKNSGDILTRNLVMRPYRPIGIHSWGTLVDYNLFVDSTSYREARGYQIDKHSIVYPIKFKNYKAGDYRIEEVGKVTSQCGFKNFEMDQFGVVSLHLKAMSQKPTMPFPFVDNSRKANACSYEWLGMVLKKINSEEEQSAAGLDSQRGIYVMSVDTLNSPFRNLLYANDVILSVHDYIIKTVEDIEKYLKQNPAKEPIKFIIYRNQKKQEVLIPKECLSF